MLDHLRIPRLRKGQEQQSSSAADRRTTATAAWILPKHPTLIRYVDNGSETLGLLFVGGRFQHYTLEDEYRNEKVYGETRIPAGTYPLELRTEGGHHQRYRHRFADIHEGMVHLLNVPNFKWILYHIGNDDDDTAGCILPGDGANNPISTRGRISHSTQAYVRTYPLLRDYIKTAEKPVIEIIDLDR